MPFEIDGFEVAQRIKKMAAKRAAELRNDGRSYYKWPDLTDYGLKDLSGPELTAAYVNSFQSENRIM